MTLRDDRRLVAGLLAAALCGVMTACSGGGSNGGGGGGTGGGGTGGGGTGGSTPSTVTALTVNPASVPGGSASQGTVTISPAPTVGTGVTLQSDSGLATVPGSVTVNSGATTSTFNIATSALAAQTAVTIRASLNSTTQQATLTLTPTPFAAVVRVVSLSQAKRKLANGTVVDIADKPAGSLNTCPLVSDGNGQRLDCEIDASGSTSPNGFRDFRYKWRLGTIDGDSGTITANKHRPAVQNCNFFGGQNAGGNQFLNMRVTVEITSTSGTTITGTVDGVSMFPAGLCNYAF